MTPETWRRVEPILTKALLLPETDRKTLVASAALDDAIRREILDLLESSGPASRQSSQSAKADATTVTLTSGDKLADGRFVVVRQIGRGGMGSVYLAHDTSLGTLVALKVVPPDDRLIREAQRAATCAGHENVATVHNVLRTEHAGERIGLLVMEHVAGRPASRILEDGPIEIDRALRWMRQAADAVAHAHDCEVLHCDLKPANLIVTPDDHVKVLDFGIARAAFEPKHTGEPAYGTLPYMAPEQLTAGEFSRASDVYSLGVTLFELVTGRLPYSGDDRMLRVRILAEPPPKVTDSVSNVPAGLDVILQRALAKNPGERFRSVRAFTRELERLDSTPRPRPPDPVPPSPGRWWIYVATLTGVVALNWIFGLIACRSFEVSLRVDSEFAASPSDYFRVGREALLPLVPLWVMATAAVAAAAGLALAVRALAKNQWDRWTRWWRQLNPNALATVALLIGISAWLALTWSYRDIFVALMGLSQHPGSAAVEAISYTSRPAHLDYSNASALLSFCLTVVGAVWLPHLRKRCSDPTTVRAIGWAALVLAVVVMLGPTMPRRFLFERFRVMEYDGRLALEIGSADNNLLLYDAQRRVSLRVSRNAGSLRSTELTRFIFQD